MNSASHSIKPAERILILGLDGATWTNLSRWIERGDMPVLRRMRDEGAWGVLNSTIPALTPPAWASLVTGTNPGKHGIYHFRHAPAGDYYQRRLNNSRDVASPTLWQRLNRHGKRVGVFNVPLSYPVYPVDGFITSDALSPEATGLSTYPPELAADFKDFVIDVLNYPGALPGTANYAREMLAFIDENERVLIHHADVALRLMKTQSWQFFMVVWLVLDRLQHYCWKFSDPALEGELKTEEEKQIGARVRLLFRQLDAQIGRLVEQAGEDCALAIVSDHGFGPMPGAFFHSNRWLEQQGYLRLLPAWHWKRVVHGNFPRVWKHRFGLPIDSKFGFVDWRKTKVWADPLESRAVGIRINCAGRYPEGIVPESEWKSLRERIATELATLKSQDGGKQFAEIHLGEDLYRGAHADSGPDLVAILSKPFDVPPSFRRDLRSRELISSNHQVLRDGGHEPEGIVLLRGANVNAGTKLSPQPIESIAATVLQLFGLPIGDDIDAEPILAALNEEFLRAYPPRRESETARPASPSSSQPEYSDKDSALVEERLRKLGYLD
ncbi:MAG: alkaline phosphatase family protein [Verrucomicrobia bacterium]|nr:alkaline phosphatase family protein [Verrucomicrobiota bacterium]